jgi:hypothetical protein
MANGTQTEEAQPKHKSFLDIASSFPADLPQETYDAARSKYFNDVVVPKIKPNESIGATWQTFKAQTERPHLLTAAGRAAAGAHIGAVAAAKAVVAPMTALDELSGATGSGPGGARAKWEGGPISQVMSDLNAKDVELTRIGEREGLNVPVLKTAGSVAGQVAAFEALGLASGPGASALAESLNLGVRGTELLSSTLRGGAAFGAYDALSADNGGRLVAGVKGFGIGAAFDLTLSTAGILARRGLIASRDVVGDVTKRAASGIKTPPPIDNALAQKATQDAVVARTEGRSKLWAFNNAQPGARVFVTDVAGKTQPIEIKPLRESDAYQQMSNIVRQGGSVSHFEVHPEDQKVLNEFLRIQSGIEQAKYKGTTLRTGNGQAPAVARAANEVGLPAEALASDTVHVATVTHEVQGAKSAPREVQATTREIVEARKQPTSEEIEKHLATTDIGTKDIPFVSRSIEKAWDPNIPTSAKQREIQIALKYAPHMLPEEYTNYALPRITAKQSYMFGQVDANAVGDRVAKVGAEALGYPVKIMDVVTGENPNRVKVYLKGNVDPAVNDSIKSILQGKLGPAYDIDFSAQPEARRFDILGARTTLPRVLTDDQVQDLVDFYDVPEGQVDPDRLSRMTMDQAKTELEAIKARVEDQGTGERTAEQRPRVTDERRRPPSKYIEQVPPSERGRVSPGDDIPRVIEEQTGAKWLDQSKVTLRTRPGGRTLVLPPDLMEKIAPGASAASHPDLKQILRELNVDPPASLGDAEPVTLLQEGKIHPVHVYHEQLHVNMLHADAFNTLSSMVPPKVQGTAVDLMNGLRKTYDLYGRSSGVNMLNEAYVHAAQAVRFSDEGYLQELATWNTSPESVKEFVNATSKNLLTHSIDVAGDSIPVRNLQRSVTDLIRRTDPAVGYELEHGMRITGSGMGAWYDPTRGWVLQESTTSQRVFNNINELWDYFHDNDRNFLSPSFTFMPEQVGVRGGMTPSGAEPNGGPPPNPEVPLGRKLAWSGISAWWRPTLPWAASLDTAVNRALRSKGITAPIYDSFKNVDDMVRNGNNWMRKASEESEDILQHFNQKKLYDVAQYLTYPEAQRTEAVMKQYGLSQEEALRAHQYGEFLKQFQADTGIDALGFLQRDYPRLRMYAWDPSGVWGPGISEKNAGFWERAVRYDQTLDPKDLNLGRFNQFLLREGMQKKFTAEPLRELNMLINRKDAAGEYLLPGNVRYPMQNYHNYMKGIPDQSQVAIQNGLGHFFDVINDRVRSLNANLPGNMKVPEITMQPKQLINKMMILSYAMGLGARPAIAVRDGIWSLVSSSVFLGPGRMTRALMESFKPEAWTRATEAGALLQRTNVGEMYGDILSEMPAGGKNLFDRLTKWSNMLLAPSRWAHNFGRNIMFNGEYLDALDAVRDFRVGKVNADALFDRTTLAAMDKPAQARLLKLAHDKSISPEQVATRFGLDAVDISEWPYRRGTQPLALRFGAGRILGQYGVWPANYIDFGARVGRLTFTNPRLATRMALMWGVTNFAASSAMEHVGVDSSKWFFLSPMGYAGSPNLEFVQNLMKAPEDTQEGRAARKAVLEYPLNFVPAMAEVEGVLKSMQEPGGNAWPPDARTLTRALGFKPLDEHVTTRDWQAWARYQLGFPKLKPGE